MLQIYSPHLSCPFSSTKWRDFDNISISNYLLCTRIATSRQMRCSFCLSNARCLVILSMHTNNINLVQVKMFIHLIEPIHFINYFQILRNSVLSNESSNWHLGVKANHNRSQTSHAACRLLIVLRLLHLSFRLRWLSAHYAFLHQCTFRVWNRNQLFLSTNQ